MRAPPTLPLPADTRDRILDAAEELIARDGIEGVSLRSVTKLAGVNLAAVHYHFGSKDGLVHTVFARRIDPINRDRLRRLDALEAAAERPPSLEDALHAFLAPVLMAELHPADRAVLIKRLMGRLFAEPGAVAQQILVPQFREVATRFLAALERVLPGLPRDVLLLRFHFIIGAMLQVALNSDLIDKHAAGLCDPTDHERMVDHLVAFAAGGLRAPLEAPRP